jgi:hypothetical protein
MLAIHKAMGAELMQRDRIYDICKNHRVGHPALLNYLKLFDPGEYINFVRFHLKDMEAVIIEHLKRAFAEREYEKYKAEYERAMELIK